MRKQCLDWDVRLTNVHDVPLAVDHDVPVVSVLDLEDITCDRVGGHRLNEVESRFLERNGVLSSVFGDEEVKQIVDFRTSHLISRCSIGNDVNDTTLQRKASANVRRSTRNLAYTRTSSGHPIRKEVERETDGSEDVLEHGDDLEGEDILSTIVADLEDGLLPNVVLGANFHAVAVTIQKSIGVGVHHDSFLAHLERGHEGSLGEE